MSGRLILALPAFLVTILGLALAVAARWTSWVHLSIGIVLILIIGLAADHVGKRLLLPTHPRAAIVAFTVWSLSPGIAASAAIAITLYLNATFSSENTGATGLDAEMTKTLVGGVSAFLAATFIKVMDDADEAVIGKHVQKAFFNRFISTNKTVGPDCYPVELGESLVEPWVFQDPVNGIEGWGWRSRWSRASNVASAMKDADEVARVQAYRDTQRAKAEALAKANTKTAAPPASGNALPKD